MIVTVAKMLLLQRLASPMRMVLAAAAFGFGVLSVLFTGSVSALFAAGMGAFGYIAAAGVIGQEVTSGVLTLTFARPIRRPEWVVGRWLGSLAMAWGLVTLQVAAALGAAFLRHGDPSLVDALYKLLEGGFAVTGTCTVLLMLSALAPGMGDLGLFVLGTILGATLSGAGMHSGSVWLARAGEEVQQFLGATLDPAMLFGREPVSWPAILAYVSTIVICVTVAIWAVNRKQLSYATG